MKKLITIAFILSVSVIPKTGFSYFALEVTQIFNRIELLFQTLDQWEQAVSDFTSDGFREDDFFDNLNEIVDEVEQVTYVADNLEDKFLEQYPGYEEYVLTATDEFKDFNMYRDRYKKWREETRTNALNSWERMKVMSEKLSDLESVGSAETISELGGANNRNQLIKASAEMNAQMVNQLQNLRQMLFDDMQMKNAAIMQREEERAYAQAETEWFLGISEGAVPIQEDIVLDDGTGQF
jgi:P-type conjugative transfer protein TrbJ